MMRRARGTVERRVVNGGGTRTLEYVLKVDYRYGVPWAAEGRSGERVWNLEYVLKFRVCFDGII